MAHADLDALKHTVETITAMRDDGLDNVDAYWERREQREMAKLDRSPFGWDVVG